MPIVPPFPGPRATLSAFFPVAHRDREEGLRLDVRDGPYAFLPGPTGDPPSLRLTDRGLVHVDRFLLTLPYLAALDREKS